MDNSTKPLLQPYTMGPFELPNRVVMAPMARMRADKKTGVPTDLHVQYYTERAENTAFIISECSPISEQGNGLPGDGGIYTDEQIEGWQKVTESIHKVNGRIFLQIWHCGRAQRKTNWGTTGVSACAIPIRFQIPNSDELEYGDTPTELSVEEIQKIVEDFKNGAINAVAAGFDGIELHGANGYLIDQFLRDAVNKRTDEYGGSIENRCRFPLQVIDALISIMGAERVGIKMTPCGRFNDMFDSDPIALYSYFISELDKRNIAFVEIARPPESWYDQNLYGITGLEQIPDVYKTFRPLFKGTIIANERFTFDEANELIASGLADMVSFGKYFIANPDLVERFKNGWELAVPKIEFLYGGGSEGLIDYPKYSAK